MSTRSVLLAVLTLVVASTACQPAEEETATTEADLEAINSAREGAVNAFNVSDVDAFVSFFANDVVLMPPNEPSVIGKEAIRPWLQAFFDQFTGEEVISTQQVVVAGDWAFDRGNLTITGQLAAGGEPFQYSGNILLIWQRQPDGSWLIAVDIWNSDLPAATEEGTEAET